MPAATPVRRLTHASGLRAVARELDTLHREMLRTNGMEAGPARLSVLNLVAACVDRDSVRVADDTISAISEHHPMRVVTVLAEPDAASSIEADLDLHCSIADGGQVCAERVHLVVGGEPAYHLASVITPLLVPDTPVYLWLVGAPPVRQALGSDAVAICERLLLDSGAYDDARSTITLLAGELDGNAETLDVADLAWERIRDWRALLASCFEGDELAGLQRHLRSTHVESCGALPSSQAWLLLGWLGSRLRWESPPSPSVSAREVDGVEAHDIARVDLEAADGARDVVITCNREGDTITAHVNVRNGPTLRRAVPFRPGDTVTMVTRLLEDAPNSRLWHDALRSAASLQGDGS